MCRGSRVLTGAGAAPGDADGAAAAAGGGVAAGLDPGAAEASGDPPIAVPGGARPDVVDATIGDDPPITAPPTSPNEKPPTSAVADALVNAKPRRIWTRSGLKLSRLSVTL